MTPLSLRGQRVRPWRAVLRNPLGVVSGSVLVLIVFASVFAPFISPHDPNLVVLSESLSPPSGNHPMGTDGNGRDILSRLLWGGQVSLQAGLIMVTTAVLVGVPSGLIAGYYSRWFDNVANWFSNMLMSLPEILIIIVVISSLGSGLAPTMITLGVLASPDLFRLTRSTVVGVRNDLYIDAARVAGLSDFRIIFRHVLSVVLGPVVVRISFIFGMAIIVQSGLEFLGFGDASRPSWGGELSTAFQSFQRAPQLVIYPGLVIGLTVMSLALFGTALADTLGVGRKSVRREKRSTPVRPVVAPADRRGPRAEDARRGEALLSVEGLTVGYPQEDGTFTTVVDDVSLQVSRGEVLGLVGESGSGKTQTVFALLGLLPSGAQTVASALTFDGHNIAGASEKQMQAFRGKRIAYVPQEPMSNLDPSFTIGTQLTRPMRNSLGLTKKEATAKAIQLLKRVGIQDPARMLASYPHEISGGMAQRVLIAGAVSCDPDVLIADEPTTALDVTVQAEVLSLLRSLQQEREMGMILVTHNLGVVADICDRVAVMRSGVIVEQQDAVGLFATPQHSYTKALLGASLEGLPARATRVETEVTRG
ncbi:peptide/nickel transport system permease protein [Mycetocola sp. CAN_C7]|uniref:dipeptide/oligopeptide/nickel ABC transporter permease/ATP-binding protein n=1 Tax=Mycetocola sp. CAN_C7 TaxID=2787724 RepID=UPI0018CB50C3